MKLSQFKNHLDNSDTFSFQLPSGLLIPSHFHITEMGLLTKNFIDCGNTVRQEKNISFQLWYSTDVDHRLTSARALTIIKASKTLIGDFDYDLEVEYQMTETIGKFGVELHNNIFVLIKKETACLALESCGFPITKSKQILQNLTPKVQKCCSPDDNCC